MVQGREDSVMPVQPLPVPLGPLARSMSAHAAGELERALDLWVQHAEERDRSLWALCPEPGRRARIARVVRALVARWPDREARPSLFGVPIGVKDLYHVAGLPTLAGSTLPPAELAGVEATAVSRLMAAGAVVLGKTTTDELAYSDPPPTVNPHDATRTPGGSSAGSAAGVACGLFPLALGTQTSRSIIAPAAFCGVVGFKASHRRIPMDGCVPLALSLDSPGVLAADVATAAAAAALLLDGYRAVAPSRPVLAIARGAFLDGLASLGWRAPFELAVQRLRGAGFDVRDLHLPWGEAELTEVYRATMTVLHGEMARAHADRLARFPDRFRARTAAGVARGLAITDTDLDEARARLPLLREHLHAWMADAGVDLLIAPSQSGPAPPLGAQTGWGDTTTPWSGAGLPCLGLPAGTIEGLPFGLQLIAPHGADEELLAGAASVEALLPPPP